MREQAFYNGSTGPVPTCSEHSAADEIFDRKSRTSRRRIFGIGDASPDADDAWAAHLRSSPRRKPPPRVPNRRPRFPTSTPPPGPSAHPSGFSIRSQQDSVSFNPRLSWLPFVPPSPRSSILESTHMIP